MVASTFRASSRSREKRSLSVRRGRRDRWAAVHVHDAARLFHLALERLPAGAAVHAVADDRVPIRISPR